MEYTGEECKARVIPLKIRTGLREITRAGGLHGSNRTRTGNPCPSKALGIQLRPQIRVNSSAGNQNAKVSNGIHKAMAKVRVKIVVTPGRKENGIVEGQMTRV